MSEQDRLAQAVELVKAGNRAEAEPVVAEVIRADRKNVRAWILMAKIVDDPQKALQCWQEVARLKPDDPRIQEEIAKLKGEPIPQAWPSEPPPNTQTVQPVSTHPIQSPGALIDQSISSQPVQPGTLATQKRKIRLPLLIVGGAAIVVVVCCVAMVVVAMNMQSDPGFQATLTAIAATTIAEENRPTDTPDRPTAIPIVATTAIVGLNPLTAIPATATIAPTATLRSIATNTPKPSKTPIPITATLEPYEKLVADLTDVLDDGNRDVKRIETINYDDTVGNIFVQWAINDSIFDIKDVAQIETMNILKAVAESGLPYTQFYIVGTFSMVDKFGNVTEDPVVKALYLSATIAKINWENFLYQDVWAIADEASIDNELR